MSYKSPGNRPPALLTLQNLKRARSAYAYGPGNTLQWYAWLREHSTHSIPSGSAVWICGVLDEGMQFPRAPALRSARSCLKRGKKRRSLPLRTQGGGPGRCAATVAERHAPPDHAKRGVAGAMQLSPYLGERMRATRFLKRSVFMRELLPQDRKLEIDQLTREKAVNAARFLAGVVGAAYARQRDSAARKQWHRALARNRSKRLSAPSWLWSGVVELTVSHAAA